MYFNTTAKNCSIIKGQFWSHQMETGELYIVDQLKSFLLKDESIEKAAGKAESASMLKQAFEVGVYCYVYVVRRVTCKLMTDHQAEECCLQKAAPSGRGKLSRGRECLKKSSNFKKKFKRDNRVNKSSKTSSGGGSKNKNQKSGNKECKGKGYNKNKMKNDSKGICGQKSGKQRTTNKSNKTKVKFGYFDGRVFSIKY